MVGGGGVVSHAERSQQLSSIPTPALLVHVSSGQCGYLDATSRLGLEPLTAEKDDIDVLPVNHTSLSARTLIVMVVQPRERSAEASTH